MSPIDDELRAALHGRAGLLAPAADPMAGIERRAHRIRRNRVVGAVAGSVLAVASLALVVPAVSPASRSAPLVPAAPSAVPPSVPPSVPPTASGRAAAAFDPARPWPYRGDVQVAADELVTMTRGWAAVTGAAADAVRLTPLYGETYPLAGVRRYVYVASADGRRTTEYGLVTMTGSGPQFLSRSPVTTSATALLVPAPGDGTSPSLLVVAAPGSRSLEYAPDGTTYRPMPARAAGVGLVAVDGDRAKDRVRVAGADGTEVFTGVVPELSDSSEPPTLGEPDNLLGWGARGARDDALVERAVAGFAAAKGVARTEVSHEALLVVASDGTAPAYVLLQAWARTARAQVFGWVETPGRPAQGQLRPVTEARTRAVALGRFDLPGRTTSELVLLVRPGRSAVTYDEGPTGDPRSVPPVPGLDGVYLVERDPRAEAVDTVRVQDPSTGGSLYSGPVSGLLCGEKECA